VIQSQILFLMTGLLFGTTLLAAGMALGFWMARRTGTEAPSTQTKSSLDPHDFLTMIRTIADSTNSIATDISKYQQRMHELVEMSRNFTGKDAEAFQPILDQILAANSHLQERLDAAEVKLEQQHSQLESYLTEARTDGLTQLPNRRAFDQGLDELYAKHQRSRQDVSLVLIDVDHFKKINDTYGHTVGDVALKRVAEHLAAFANDCHLVARYGGEEFGILVAGSIDQAAEIAEAIRAAIANDPFEAEGHSLRLTISAGAAQLSQAERIGDLVRRSDQALYRAKQEGRNRVIASDPANDLSRNPTAQPAPQNAPATPAATTSTPNTSVTAATAATASATSNSGPTYRMDGADNDLSGIEEIEKRLLDHLDQMVQEESKR
jgi:diguanylate cyclase